MSAMTIRTILILCGLGLILLLILWLVPLDGVSTDKAEPAVEQTTAPY
jgi:hypothetical protein